MLRGILCTFVNFSISINGMFLCTQGDEKILLCYVLGLVAQSCPTLWSFGLYPCQTPLSMRFFRQEYWSGFPFPPPGGNTFTFGQNMMESTQNIFCLIIIIIQMPSSKHLFYPEEHKHLVKGFLHCVGTSEEMMFWSKYQRRICLNISLKG